MAQCRGDGTYQTTTAIEVRKKKSITTQGIYRMLKTGLRVKEETKDHLDGSGQGEQVNDSAIHQERDYERKRRTAITVRHPTIDVGN